MTQTKIKKLIKILVIALTGIGLIAMLVVGSMFLASSEKVTGENQSVVLADSSGTCGDNLTWTLDNNGVLTISGTGDMTSSPWTKSAVKEVIIENGVTSIGRSAFYECNKLTSVTIGTGLESIHHDAFNSSSMTSIIIDENNLNLSIENGVLYNKNKTELKRFYTQLNQNTSFIIPSSVTSIGDYAFSGCSGLTSIEIQNGVTSIGYEAFYRCYNLTSINIPSSVTSIGNGAFSSCRSLTSINIGSGLTDVSNLPIDGDKLTTITVDENNTEYSSLNGVLYNRTKTEIIRYPKAKIGNTFSIPSGVTSIKNEAFYGCSGLTSVSLPSSVTTIGAEAFAYCRGLRSITLNEGLESIGSDAFQYCTNLRSITLPESLLSIGTNAFDHCNSIVSLNIPKNVNSIGANIVSNCASLNILTVDPLNTTYNDGNGSNVIVKTSDDELIAMTTEAEIPNTITIIGDSVFEGRTDLTEVFIPYGVTSIGKYAFCGCTNLTSVNISNSVTSIDEYAFAQSGLISVNIPNSVTSIGVEAFWYCERLTSVSIGSGLTNIYNETFLGCSNLISITVASSNSNFSAQNGVLYNKNKTSLLLYPARKTNTSFTIPNSVTRIENNAFYNCTGLTSITIPSSVTSIGEGAFDSCSNLTSINIPDSVTYLGHFALINCYKLNSITIGKGLTNFNTDVILSSDSIKEINVNPDNPNYSSENGVLYNKDETVLIYYPTGKDSLIFNIPNTVTTIKSEAFYYCKNLSKINIPSSVINIEQNAFCYSTFNTITVDSGNSVYNDGNGSNKIIETATGKIIIEGLGTETETSGNWGDNLSWVLSDEGVLTISGNGYMGDVTCNPNAVKHIIAGEGVGLIDYKLTAFKNLKSITVDPNNQEYSSQDGVLYNKDKTSILIYPAGKTDESFTISDSVTHVYGYAFNNSKLKTINIPHSVTYINGQAFNLCGKLESITIPNSVTNIQDTPFTLFNGCGNLKSIIVEDGNPYYNDGNGSNCIIETATGTLFAAGKDFNSLTIPDGVVNIRAYAFRNYNLTSIRFPSGVAVIGHQSFEYCKYLTSIEIPSSVMSIGSDAFSRCSSLTSVIIENGLTNITGFSYCTNLNSINIPSSVTSIGQSAFSGCSSLTSIEIPRDVESIGYQAFYNALNAKIVFKSTTVPTIGSNAFGTDGTNMVSHIFVPNSALADYQAALPNYLSIIEGYDPSDQVTITWQNWDGATLDEEQVAFADLPVYNSAPPTREATAKYSYEWDGWTLPIELATEDATYTASFTRNGQPYTITYDSNDGTNRTLTQNVIYTGSFTTYNYDAFERAGYKIVGWSKDPNTQTGIYCDVGTYYGFEDTEDITLYAMWSEEYSITYNLNGGSVATANRDWYTAATQTFTLVNPTKQYYTFTGWTGSNGSIPETTVTVEKGTTGNLTYTANWTPVEYTISYTLNGGTAENVGTYTIESANITLVNPTKDHYDFTGWTGSNGDEPELDVTIPQGSTGNKGYVANWTPTVYTITTTVDGVDSTQNYTVESESITLTNPSKIGYNFLGWTGSNGDDPELEVIIPTGSYGDKEYTANFEAIEYTITYTLNGGVASNPSTYTVESNSITLVNPTKAGYNFVGWTGSNGDEPETTVTIPQGSTGNKAYTANWSEAIIYTITYTLNGGEAENPISYTVESSKITLAQPTRAGATFKGWTGSNGNTAQKTVYINTGSTGDKTYTANWTLISYKLTYTLNGGTVSPANPKNFNVETATFTLNNPTKANYDFLGWTGGGLEEPTLEVTIETGSINARTYVANWAPTEYSITYTLNGGIAENIEVYTVESNSITLVNPTKAGYNFVGWTGTGLEGPTMEVVIPQGSTGNKAYIANFEVVVYTITTTVDGVESTQNYTVESENITLENPTKLGYNFVGWTGTDLDEETMEVVIPQGSTGNKAYTANFEVITYTITYTLNGGTAINSTSYTVESGSITLVNPTKAGYNFVGWTGSNGEEPEVEVVISNGSTGDKVYTANFEVITYTITITIDGVETTQNYTVESNSITFVNPTKLGYTFTGWTGSNGEEPSLEVVISQGSTGNKEYVANWSLNQYKITLHIDGETKVINYNVLSKDQVIEKPSKKGFNFLGWTGEDLTEATMDLVIPKGSTGDREYTATWEEAPTNTLAIALGVGIPAGAILITGVVLIVLAKQKKIKLW